MIITVIIWLLCSVVFYLIAKKIIKHDYGFWTIGDRFLIIIVSIIFPISIIGLILWKICNRIFYHDYFGKKAKW
jgi:hypothetical protein